MAKKSRDDVLKRMLATPPQPKKNGNREYDVDDLLAEVKANSNRSKTEAVKKKKKTR